MLFKSTDFFLLRLPSYSINHLIELNSHIQSRDLNAVKRLFTDDLFLKAIYFSSRNFYKVALVWLQNDKNTFDSKDRILITLYKYYSRMCSRATPFGFFAGFAVGEITNEDTLIELGEKYFNPQIRIDLSAFRRIKDSILEKYDVIKRIDYYPNNTIFEHNNLIRYIDWDKNFHYSISEVDKTLLLQKILIKSEKGIRYKELVDLIKQGEHDASEEEINNFISSLIQSKILVDRLPPYLTDTNDTVITFERNLLSYQITERIDIIKNIKKIISKSDININDIETIYEENKEILSGEQQLFQIDLKLDIKKNKVDKKIIQKIIEAAEDLKFISNNKPVQDIHTFCKNFRKRYEDEEVELVKALDPQIGIGYGLQVSGNVEETPLLESIAFSYRDHEKFEISPIIKTVLKNYIEYFSVSKGKPIKLTKEDIQNSVNFEIAKEFHNTYYFFGNLLSNNLKGVNENNFKFFSKASLPAPNFNTVLSRFSYHDEILAAKMTKMMNKSNNVIYAEVVNSSNARLGNVLLRPNFYEYEIPYISETNGEKIKININDILVSVINNEIVLRSKSLGKIIKPVMSTAYNYHIDQLSVIRFLGDLQYYNIYRGFNWDWGALSDSDYLPRIEYKEIILSEARWKLNKNSYDFNTLTAYLLENKIPKYCNIRELDNTLLLDTENILSQELLISMLKKQDVILFESFIESSFIQKGDYKYLGEFVVPIENTQTTNSIEIREVKNIKEERFFYPGDGWSYFKFYCSHNVGDNIVCKIIVPLIEDLTSKTNPISWFYIRYNDPENHIRFRINKKLDNDLIEKINHYSNPLIEIGLISNIQIDTYKREIERYSGFGINDVEKIFHFDSKAIAEFIKTIEIDNNEDIRWMVAVESIHLLMEDFSISLNERVDFSENQYKQFLTEFVDISDKNKYKDFKSSIDSQYRKYKYFFEEIIQKGEFALINNEMQPFKKRSIHIRKILALKTEVNYEDKIVFLKSLIHMSLNRIFFTKQRMYELIVYFFLYQCYKSKFLRNANSKKYSF